MEYKMTQRGKDRGSWPDLLPDLKRQSDAIVQAFAKFMSAASVKSRGASARSLRRWLRHRSDMRRREIVLRVRLSAKKVFHPQAWRVRSAGPKPWRRVREGRGEIALAERGKLPKIVTDADISGILHAHTDRSDGGDTLEVMAEATCVRGTWRNDVGKRKAQQDGDMSRLNDRKLCGKHL
jgi:hypothetical protein